MLTSYRKLKPKVTTNFVVKLCLYKKKNNLIFYLKKGSRHFNKFIF